MSNVSRRISPISSLLYLVLGTTKVWIGTSSELSASLRVMTPTSSEGGGSPMDAMLMPKDSNAMRTRNGDPGGVMAVRALPPTPAGGAARRALLFSRWLGVNGGVLAVALATQKVSDMAATATDNHAAAAILATGVLCALQAWVPILRFDSPAVLFC